MEGLIDTGLSHGGNLRRRRLNQKSLLNQYSEAESKVWFKLEFWFKAQTHLHSRQQPTRSTGIHRHPPRLRILRRNRRCHIRPLRTNHPNHRQGHPEQNHKAIPSGPCLLIRSLDHQYLHLYTPKPYHSPQPDLNYSLPQNRMDHNETY